MALSAILAISLVPLSPATAWANDPAGQAGEVVQASAASEAPTETSVASVASGDSTLYYDTLEDAVDNAADGSVVTLLQNVEINAPITVASNITLSLDGHTVTNNVSKERAFVVAGSGFTVDGTAAGSQMVIPESNTGSYGFIKVTATATVTLNGGKYSGSTDGGAFVKLFNGDGIDASGSTVIFNETVMTSNNRFFSTDTLTTSADVTTLEVNGGSFETTGQAFGSDLIYRSKIYFTDAEVTAGTGPCIEVCGPAATFTDCTFTVTDENSNGFGTTAVATSYSGSATINGGAYSAPNGYGAYVYDTGGEIVVNDGYVSGGDAAVRADAGSSKNPGATANITVKGGMTDGEWQTNDNDNATLSAAGGTHTDDSFKDYLDDGTAVRQKTVEGKTAYSVYGSADDALKAEGGGYSVVIGGHTWVFDTQEEAQSAAEKAGENSPEIVLKHVVTFSNQGAETKAFAQDGSPVEEPADPTRAGYIFLGWYTSDGRLYDFTTPVTADMTLTARWAAIPVVTPDPSYDVAVDQPENGGVAVSPESAEEGETVTVTVTPDLGYELAQLTVADEDGDALELTENADGTYSFTMPAGDVTVHASFADAWENPFTDVSGEDWFYGAVRMANLLGLMKGYDGTTLFGPDDPLAREQAATVMWNLMGDGDRTAPAAPQADVDQSGWYAPFVNWAVESGVMNGYAEGAFGVGEALTREQFAAVVANAAKADLGSVDLAALDAFPDADGISEWARPVMAWAVEAGVVNGFEAEDGTRELQAQRTVTRAEMAAMVMNAIDEGVLELSE